MDFLLFTDKNINNIYNIINNLLLKSNINIHYSIITNYISFQFNKLLDQYDSSIFDSDIRLQLIELNKLCIDYTYTYFIYYDNLQINDKPNDCLQIKDKPKDCLQIKDKTFKKNTNNIQFDINTIKWYGTWNIKDNKLFFNKAPEINTILLNKNNYKLQICDIKQYFNTLYIDYVSIDKNYIIIAFSQTNINTYCNINDYISIKNIKVISNFKEPYIEDNNTKYNKLIQFLITMDHLIINVYNEYIYIHNSIHLVPTNSIHIIGSVLNISTIPKYSIDILQY